MSFFLWLFFTWNHINQGWRRFGTYFKLDLFLLWLLDSIKKHFILLLILAILVDDWWAVRNNGNMDDISCCNLTKNKMGSFWFKIFRIVYWTRICRYFFSVPPNGNVLSKGYFEILLNLQKSKLENCEKADRKSINRGGNCPNSTTHLVLRILAFKSTPSLLSLPKVLVIKS